MAINKLYFKTDDDSSIYCSIKYSEYNDFLPHLSEGSLNNAVIKISGFNGEELEIMSYDQLRWMGFESVVLPDGTRVALESWREGKFDDMLDDFGFLLLDYIECIWPTLIDTKKVRPCAIISTSELAFKEIVNQNSATEFLRIF